ncbi:ABC transporter ATP-binding protein [Paenibacillus eucommiae]|uniref:Simple sugar transport system ATP-binding protein n=1 Tax=Paenibacillus eucommiae TaxID=1355755 RepID=A0ABS4IXE4_9BACL|nr:ABC transporter ATP-binding protein [Paenibacillus eucommiae]MBP1992255.1 simple sugar transport system ATP-binding protein [Paenibacillus eucommiae]
MLQMDKITKLYGSFTANRDIHFTLEAGEVHAIVGENGAGKTTLMRILYGMEQPTFGTIRIRGEQKVFSTPSEAIRSGIGMVHQHFMLFQSFTIAENIVIGHEPGSRVKFNRSAAAAKVKELSQQYGMPVDPWSKVSDCPLGIQQRVEILKVLHQGADIIILDEPTGVLTPFEIKELLQTIKKLSEQGKSIIIISHKLNEILEVADRITVLRDGQITGTVRASDTDVEQLSRMMVGRELMQSVNSGTEPGKKVLSVENISIRGVKGKPVLDQVNFAVQAGEIVGIAGISGNGQSELIQAITGLGRIDEGQILLADENITNASVRTIREKGIAHIPEDRYQWGAAAESTLVETGLMGHQHKQQHQRFGLLRSAGIRRMVQAWVDRFSVKTASIDADVRYLSGGNLQKLIVARELAQDSSLLIAAEPTRGVDVGAMELIHEELLKKRDTGTAILLLSTELSEIIKLSDRILVMFEGRVTGELSSEHITEEKISLLMAGGGQIG